MGWDMADQLLGAELLSGNAATLNPRPVSSAQGRSGLKEVTCPPAPVSVGSRHQVQPRGPLGPGV